MIKFSRPRFFGSCFAGLGLWYVFSTVSIFPSYLAYFNEIVGPERGYHYLADSNLDWGQDLKRLKVFMDQRDIKKLYLSYFGTADPCFYGIKPIYLPGSLSLCRQKPDGGGADFIAISTTNLQSVYLPNKKSFDWLKAYEPIGRVGYSIFVYEIQGDVSAHNNLGILYLNYGMVKDAVKEFNLVVDLSPKEPMAYSNLGYAYSRLSSFDRAEAAYREALKLDSDNSVAKAGLKGIERLKKKKHQRL
jgi:tetratricopeptide (TPR) repeat protein